MGSKVLSDEMLSLIIKSASAYAIESYKKEHEIAEKKRRKNVKNSAKVLLKNYRDFKEMQRSAVYDAKTTTDDSLEDIIGMMQGLFRDDDFKILSIKAKVARTSLMTNHIDTMLGVFKYQMESSSNPEDARCWRVIDALYISDKKRTREEVALKENIDQSTVWRDCEKAYQRLAILFFGVDGMYAV